MPQWEITSSPYDSIYKLSYMEGFFAVGKIYQGHHLSCMMGSTSLFPRKCMKSADNILLL